MISVTTGEVQRNWKHIEGCLSKTLRIRKGMSKEVVSKVRPKELAGINQRRQDSCKTRR